MRFWKNSLDIISAQQEEMPSMRLMGLDVGSKTVGVAVSDLMGWTAQGVETIPINENASEFGFKRVVELVEEYGVEKIVIGLPKNMNNTEGTTCRGVPSLWCKPRETTRNSNRLS